MVDWAATLRLLARVSLLKKNAVCVKGSELRQSPDDIVFWGLSGQGRERPSSRESGLACVVYVIGRKRAETIRCSSFILADCQTRLSGMAKHSTYLGCLQD